MGKNGVPLPNPKSLATFSHARLTIHTQTVKRDSKQSTRQSGQALIKIELAELSLKNNNSWSEYSAIHFLILILKSSLQTLVNYLDID